MKPANAKDKPRKYGIFHCDVCNKEFHYKVNLWRHEKVHTSKKEFKCPHCPYECKLKKYLVRHMFIHNGTKPYRCDECGKEFTSSHSLTSHKYIHTNEKPYQCSFCAYACRDRSTLRKHEDRHAGRQKVYQCKLCTKSYKSTGRLQVHVAEAHMDLDLKRHVCAICNGHYKTKATLTHHIKTVHEKSSRVACEICGHVVSHRGNLRAHMTKHIDAKPFTCGFKGCDKRYKDKVSADRHRLVHFPSRQFRCSQCDRRFTRRTRLLAHTRSHSLTRARKVECHHCGDRFYNKKYLATHIHRKHGRKRQRYECDICGLVTTNKPSIVMHLKYGHRSDDDRECNICHTIYKKHKYLKMHYLKTHNIRYKTKKRKVREPSIEIKRELPDLSDVEEATLDNIDLFDIEKEEFLGFPEPQNPKRNDTNIEEIPEILPVKIAGYPENLSQRCFKDVFAEHIEVRFEDKVKKKQKNVIRGEQDYAQKHLDKLLSKARRKRKAEALEELRQRYNVRIQRARGQRQENVTIKYFDTNSKAVASTNSERKMSDPTSKKDSRVDQDRIVLERDTIFGEENADHKTAIDTEDRMNDGNHDNDRIIVSEQIQNNYKSIGDSKDVSADSNIDINVNGNEERAESDDKTSGEKELTITRPMAKVHDLKIKLPYSRNNGNNDRIAVVQEEMVAKRDDKTGSEENADRKTVGDCEGITAVGDRDVNDVNIFDKNDRSTIQEEILLERDNHIFGEDNLDIKSSGEDDDNVKNYDNKDGRIIQEEILLERDHKMFGGENVDIKFIDAIDDITADGDEGNTESYDKSDPEPKLLNRSDKLVLGNELDHIADGNNDICDSSVEEQTIVDHKTVVDGDEDNNINGKNDNITIKINGKIKLNTHQCYICFKLFSTKETLIHHCRDHFDICNENTLKKCPVCGYVTELTITRHMARVHDLKIKLPYSKINDKKDNKNGSRYFYRIDSGNIENVEIIPSVKLLNKQAYIKIDKKARLQKDKRIEKTKLVKKGKEWVVEKDKFDVKKDFLLSKVTEADVILKLGDTYFDRLKNLSLIAKKRGSKILYPCEGCDKICQTLSALKLHNRKHEQNPKPFRKKVWKHKMAAKTDKKQKTGIKKTCQKTGKIIKIDQETGKTVNVYSNRFADPKPIVNKHKCEKGLMEFYKDNIKGGDVEFWQFLKIFNKMNRENINDFQELEKRTDFGIHTVNNNVTTEDNKRKVVEKIRKDKKNVKVKDKFTRSILISKKEHIRRKAKIKELRDNISRNTSLKILGST